MTQKLILLLIPCLLAVGLVACGDDEPGAATVNQKFAFRVDDKFTYDYYQRDSNNVRDDASKQVVIWTVLRVDLDTLNKKGVTEIEEVRYDATGATEEGRSKIYMRTNSDGALELYDLVGTVLNRFSGGLDLTAYLDQVPKDWATIGSTNDANARILLNVFAPISTTLEDMVVVATDPFDVKLDLDVRADHKGAMEVTVPAGTYDKAYVTDTKVFVEMMNKDAVTVAGNQILPANQKIINDSVSITYQVDANDGVLAQKSDSKSVLAANAFPTQITGYEMELTAVERAPAEE